MHSYEDIELDGRHGDDSRNMSLTLLTFQIKFRDYVMSKVASSLFQLSTSVCSPMFLALLSVHPCLSHPLVLFKQLNSCYSLRIAEERYLHMGLYKSDITVWHCTWRSVCFSDDLQAIHLHHYRANVTFTQAS